MDFSPPLQVCKGLFIGDYLEQQREGHDTLRNFLTPHPSPPPQGGREQGHFPCRHDVERSSAQTGRRRPNTLPVPPNPPSSFPLHPHCPSRSFKRESRAFSPPLQVCKGLFIGDYLEQQRESHDTLRNFLTPHPSPPPQGGREPGEGIWPSGRKRPAPSRVAPGLRRVWPTSMPYRGDVCGNGKPVAG